MRIAPVLSFTLVLALVSVPCTQAQYAWFARHTDSIRIPGQTVLQNTATYETRFWMPKATAHSGFIFDEWTDGQEDKRLLVGPVQIAGGSYPQSVNSAPKGIIFAQISPSPEEWHHLAFVTDETSDRLYLDGRMVAAMNRETSIQNGSGEARVGAILRSDGSATGLTISSAFIGFIDYVRVSKVARYSGPRFDPPVGDLSSDGNTLLLYNFNDLPDSPAVLDESPSKRHGTLGASFEGATRPLLVASVSHAPETWSTNIAVNPRASYIRANGDAAYDAVPIILSELGIQPGERIFVQQIGDFNRDIETSPREPERSYRMSGVFSRTSVLLKWGQPNRVPGAVKAGESVGTPATATGGFSTDIPEDFAIPAEGRWIDVPADALFLFVAAMDSRYADNYDLDFNYGVHIERPGVRLGSTGQGVVMDWSRGTLQESDVVPADHWTDRSDARPPFLPVYSTERKFFRLRD